MGEIIKEGKDRSAIAAGLILLVLAAGFLLVLRRNIDLGNLTLPLYLIASGLFLFVTALEAEGFVGEGVASLGGTTTVLGLLLLYQYGTGDWESWAYAWPLPFPTGFGLGQFCYGAVKGLPETLERGKVLFLMGLGMCGLGIIFYKLLFS